jgi:RNA polymerase sigma factor (sigma-70 family)
VVVRDELVDFGAFYERTYPRAFGIAYGVTGERGLAEDATQDAFVAAYRERTRYRGDGPVEAWLYRIVVNTAISATRRRRVRFIVPLDPVADREPAPGDTAGHALDQVALADGLQHLDPRARSAVILRYYLDLDYEAIARILGTSTSNVGAILSRSLDRLRATVEPEPASDRVETPELASTAGRGVTWHG